MLTRRKALRIVVSLLFLGALGATLWIVGCSEATDPWANKPEPHILVSVPPLDSFAKSVAGEHGWVECLCKGNGPHEYNHTQADINKLRGAKRFFTIGMGLDDHFSDPMAKTAGKGDSLIKLGDLLPADLKHNFADEDKLDPHVWNGTPQAIKMVESIRDELKKVDPANKADYDKNAAAYIDNLKQLHEEGIALLKDKKNKKIVSFHESLGYFAREFEIEIVAVIEDLPGNEADRTKINKLIDKCIKEDVLVIAVEPQYPKTGAAKLLKDRVNEVTKGERELKLVEIDPLETADAKDLKADLYIETMRKNLKALADNLP